MQKLLRGRLVLGTCALACALTGVGVAEEKPAAGDKGPHKSLVEALKDVHNRGADLYNSGDQAGCYRMFQGALLTARPLVGADVQKAIDDGLARATSAPRSGDRAFVLHETIESVRAKLKPAGAAKTPDKKPVETTRPPDKKPVETRPPDRKPVETKPPDKKPVETTKPPDKKPVDTKPPEKKPEDKKPEDKKPEDKKSEDKKSEDKKPDDKTVVPSN